MCVWCSTPTCTLDYRFLEDTGRFADGTTRDNLIRAPRTTFKVSSATKKEEHISSSLYLDKTHALVWKQTTKVSTLHVIC